jgi:hypothetical protein
LLPRLSSDNAPSYVEATAEETEARLLRGLRKYNPALSPELDLRAALVASRNRMREGSSKILLVIDQFEQWYHAKGNETETELAGALCECDGGRLQAIILVRDDYSMALHRFMAVIGVRQNQDQNFAVVDLFDLQHARKVLIAFGRGYGMLPDDSADMTGPQNEFLDRTIRGLSQDGRVVSVRLALFAEMLKGKPWTLETLKKVGGAEGVGVTFLEETFSARTAPPLYRIHERAAQAVLKALLPEIGSNIKGNMRSHAELLVLSGYESRRDDFEELVRILNTNLRLISPTEPEGSDGEGQVRSRVGEKYFLLTHDYLVPSIRDWLTRKQKETRRGRAELRLAERSSLWNAKPENRHLPSGPEWASIQLLTRKLDWTEPQRRMMKQAGRVCAAKWLTFATILMLLSWGVYEANGRLRAQMLRDKLLASPLADVPGILAELQPYRRWVDRLLRQAHAEATTAGNSEKLLRAALALLPVDDTKLPYLRDRLLGAEAQDIPVLRQCLASHKDYLVAECSRVLERPSSGDHGKALQAASALALYDPAHSLWEKISMDVANRLVTQNAYVVANWIDALRPVARPLSVPLAAIFRDEKRGESERTLAANALAEYLSNQPDELTKLLLDATERQFTALYSAVEGLSDQTGPILEVELDKKPPSLRWEAGTDLDIKVWVTFRKRQANASVALIRMGRKEKSWTRLRHGPDPTLRSDLLHRLGPLGAEPGFLITRLEQESDVSIRRALILGLGEYGQDRTLTAERDGLTKLLLDLYRNDPDPGIHGAAEWLLRQWQNQNQVQGIDQELAKLPVPTLGVGTGADSSRTNNREWYVNSQGQTMVIVRNPVEFDMGEGRERHRERIGHDFAIASKEVTVEQFQWFLKANPRIETKNKEAYSPEPTCPTNSLSWYDASIYWMIALASSGVAGSTILRWPSVPRCVSGPPRRSAATSTVSAPPGLIPE